MSNPKKQKREPRIKTADGPYKIIFRIGGEEVTRDEVIAHINNCVAEKRARDSVKKGV